jgi:hypothetical protein
MVKAALRETPDQRHLAAFEAEPDAAAGTGFLPFVTPPAGLAMAGAFATADALSTVPGAGAWFQIM